MFENDATFGKGICIRKREYQVSNYMMGRHAGILLILIFNLHGGGWNQGPLDTAAT
jgi:acetyl esterase/lipase